MIQKLIVTLILDIVIGLFLENSTKLLVISHPLTQREPSKFPTFFNPAAKLNRDISIEIYKSFIKDKKEENILFVDTMAGPW